ncbi:MAG: glycosyltransferase family 2 protein [Lachnospirales bacterium]
MADILYVVIPCYKEEEVLPETSKRMKEKMNSLISQGKISDKSRVMFVNDGSTDKTWEIISNLHKSDNLFSGVNLSRNRGHQNALLAGLMTAKDYADMVISMDADLQDDINAIDGMVSKYYEGCDVVYGVRSSRDKDTFFKKFTAEGFYKIMKAMGGNIVFNHADYRLMSKRALEGLSEFREVNLFLRGIVPEIGYKSGIVEYERAERFAGESKYPLKKMLSFAFDGITSFSIKPIRFIINLGFVISFVSVIALIWSISVKIWGNSEAGWSSLMASIWLIGGIQLLSIGVIGEYIGKMYKETKQRPRFIIESVLNDVE